MVAAARTAPKAGGRDSIQTLILTGEDKDRLADVMLTEGRAGETNLKNVQDAGAVILIGVDFGSKAKWSGARVLEPQTTIIYSAHFKIVWRHGEMPCARIT